MVKTKKKLFRGLSFDMTLAQVKETEDLNPELEYRDYLRFKILADSIAAGESVDVEYFFNKKDQLDLMIAFYNLSGTDDIQPLINELKNFLENKYGRAKQDELGWYHWEFDDRKGEPGTIEINLVGETEEGYRGVELELIKYYGYEKRL